VLISEKKWSTICCVKGWRRARRPGYIAITALWKGLELGNGGRDSELRVSRRKIAPIFYLPASIYLLRHYAFLISRAGFYHKRAGDAVEPNRAADAVRRGGVRVFQKEPKRKVN
jgi:hypothetical protein